MMTQHPENARAQCTDIPYIYSQSYLHLRSCFTQAQELGLRTAKHKTGKEKLAQKEAREVDIANLMKAEDKVNNPVGEILPMAQCVYRVKVLKRAAVPLAKLESFRDLLEENMYRLSDRRHMSDLVPLIVAQEQTEIKKELSGRPVSVVFDSTTRLGEAMAVVLIFVDSSFTIQQRLIRLQLLAKSMTGEVQYSVGSNLVVAMMHDRAACNRVAVRTLKIVFPSMVDVGCFSHTLDLVRDKFCTPHLDSFAV